MNTGQMMMTLGAVMLLSFLILRVNSSQVVSHNTIVDSKLGIVGLTVANAYVDFAKKQAFDFAIIDTTLSSVDLTDLKAPATLGPEGETYPIFNDFDDFNLKQYNIVITDTSTLANATNSNVYTPFYITSDVYYVTEANLNVKSNVRTWFKRIDVFVWTDGLTDTIKYSSISTRW